MTNIFNNEEMNLRNSSKAPEPSKTANQVACILGITGGFGYHMAKVWLAKQRPIRALVRNPDKVADEFKSHPLVTLVTGDANNEQQLAEATKGAQVLVYGINVPYPKWHDQAEALLDRSLQQAERLGMRVIFPGNVYVFDPNQGALFHEQSPQRAISTKGEIRIRMEQRLKRASERGAQVLIIRGGDFIGPHAPSTWLDHLVKATKNGVNLSAAGAPDLTHTWAYLPDMARAAVGLADQVNVHDRWQESFRVYHLPGYQVNFHQLSAALGEALDRQVKLTRLPWWFFQAMAWFSPLFKEILEMRYLWQQPLNLDGRKLARDLPDFQPTPLPEALLNAQVI